MTETNRYQISNPGTIATPTDTSIGATPVTPPAVSFAIPFDIPLCTNIALDVKATGAAKIEEMRIENTGTVDCFLQIFSVPAAGVLMGTTTPHAVIPVPGNGTAGFELDNVLRGVNVGGTGLSMACTTTATGSTAATGVRISGVYE